MPKAPKFVKDKESLPAHDQRAAPASWSQRATISRCRLYPRQRLSGGFSGMSAKRQ